MEPEEIVSRGARGWFKRRRSSNPQVGASLQRSVTTWAIMPRQSISKRARAALDTVGLSMPTGAPSNAIQFDSIQFDCGHADPGQRQRHDRRVIAPRCGSDDGTATIRLAGAFQCYNPRPGADPASTWVTKQS